MRSKVFFTLLIIFINPVLINTQNPNGKVQYAEAPAGLKFFSSTPENTSDSLITLSGKNVSITIDAHAGSRVTSLKLNGEELLSVQVYNKNYGSILRLSPQGKWKGTEVLNNLAYNVNFFNTFNLRLKSENDILNGFKFSNHFKISDADTSIVIRYVITNIAKDIQEVAPWDVILAPTNALIVKSILLTFIVNEFSKLLLCLLLVFF